MVKSATLPSFGSKSSLQDRRVVVVGASGCGKTCLVKQLIGEDKQLDFSRHSMTIDESYFTIQPLANGELTQVQFIDTAPWMEFPAMHRLYISSCHIAIVTYDITSNTWKEDIRTVIEDIRKISDEIDIIVVGTNCDKANVLTSFTPAHVQEVIGSNVRHVYVSSLTGFGISRLWKAILLKDSESAPGSLTRNAIPLHNNGYEAMNNRQIYHRGHNLRHTLAKLTCGIIRDAPKTYSNTL